MTGQVEALTIDRQSAAPMYLQLRQLIVDSIIRDGLASGDVLPGEHRLCEYYGVSRTVVRQALAQLGYEGLVERVKGKGTFVAHPKTSETLVHTLVGLYEDVERRGGHVHSDVIRHELEPASMSVADTLGVEPGAEVVVLERLRWVQGEPWSLATTWMPEPVGALTLGANLEDASLYRLLAEHEIIATQGVRSTEATVASPEQAKLLGVEPGSPLLKLQSVSRNVENEIVEYFVAYHRGDRSRFEFELRADDSRLSMLHVADGGHTSAGHVAVI